MLPDETPLSGRAVRARLGLLKGGKEMHANSLKYAIEHSGFPCQPNPFGRGFIFFWSEIQEYFRLRGTKPEADAPGATPPPIVRPLPKRGPGRPRKAVCR